MTSVIDSMLRGLFSDFQWKVFFLDALRFYLLITLALTVISYIRMYVMQYYATDRRKGRSRMKKLLGEKRFRSMPIYSPEQIRDNSRLAAVRLTCFPNDTGEVRKYVIICPGGAYAHLDTDTEGYPVAARLNELGYTAFILEYRVGFNCAPHAPMYDLAQAVRFIEAHAGEFGVLPEDYAVIGFSAGGNLAGIFGTHAWGYDHYNSRKPGALLLGYPWTNINHWLQHPYWNIWIGLMGIWCSERGNLFMFKPTGFYKKKNRDSVCVQNWVTDDYPPTYMFAGGNDILVPSASHTDVLEQEFKRHNVPYRYDKFFGVVHGVGLGEKTKAEGWLDQAVDFWEKETAAKKL